MPLQVLPAPRCIESIAVHKTVPLLLPREREATDPSLLDPVENRKSGLSLNHIIGCPLNCAYCVRHLFGNFDMKMPKAIMSDEDAVARLTQHPYFTPNVTPIQVFNRATDPFLPSVKEHTFQVLRLLANRGLTNHVLVITRFRVEPADAERLNEFAPLRVTLLVTYSGLDDETIEPLGSDTAAASLKTAFDNARSFRTILYWRPLILGKNDSDGHIDRAVSLSKTSHATVFTGLFFRDSIREYYQEQGLPEPYTETARRKVLPKGLDARVTKEFAARGGGPLFRKTSCGVAFAHGVVDYNGHYGIRDICDICPAVQVARCCAAFQQPTHEAVSRLARKVKTTSPFRIDEHAITFDALDEQHRYHIQHTLGFQVHDSRHPHKCGRHGRADVGWEGQDRDDD